MASKLQRATPKQARAARKATANRKTVPIPKLPPGKPSASGGQVLVSPAQAPVYTPPTPFLTAEQLQQYGLAEAGWTGDVGAAGADVQEAEGQRRLGQHDLEQQRVQGFQNATENNASRGVGRSSIQQHALSDIANDIQNRRTALDNLVSAAQARLAAREASIKEARNVYKLTQLQQAVENAREAGTGTYSPPVPAVYGPAPAPPAPPTPPPTAPASAKGRSDGWAPARSPRKPSGWRGNRGAQAPNAAGRH